MSANVASSTNPYAYMPPSFAYESQASAYIIICVSTILTWDWILCLEEEYKVVKKRGLCISVLAYFLARIGITGFSIMSAVFQTSPVADCFGYMNAMGGMTVLATAANFYLFFLRVRAVYENARSITIIFGAWWLALIGTTLVFPFSISTSHLASTGHCYVSTLESWTTISMWVNMGYDTSIFLAISCRIVSYSVAGRAPNRRVISSFRGDGLPRMCRDLLHQGQLYYFVTIGFTILGAFMAVLPVHPVSRAVFTYPALAVETIMTCRVFRAVALGCIADVNTITPRPVLTTAMETCDMALDTLSEPEPRPSFGGSAVGKVVILT